MEMDTHTDPKPKRNEAPSSTGSGNAMVNEAPATNTERTSGLIKDLNNLIAQVDSEHENTLVSVVKQLSKDEDVLTDSASELSVETDVELSRSEKRKSSNEKAEEVHSEVRTVSQHGYMTLTKPWIL